jgi:hypothetical protein
MSTIAILIVKRFHAHITEMAIWSFKQVSDAASDANDESLP